MNGPPVAKRCSVTKVFYLDISQNSHCIGKQSFLCQAFFFNKAAGEIPGLQLY